MHSAECRVTEGCSLSVDTNAPIHPYLGGVFLVGSKGQESACSAGDPGSVSGSGRFPGGGPGNPLQSSCLENSIDLAGYSPQGRTRLCN